MSCKKFFQKFHFLKINLATIYYAKPVNYLIAGVLVKYFIVCLKNIIVKFAGFFYFVFKYSSIAFAAFFPAPIASITVAAPVTVSPPA